MVKSSAVEISFKSYLTLESYWCPVLKIQREMLVRPDQLAITLKWHIGFQFFFNGTTFHHICQNGNCETRYSIRVIFRDIAGVRGCSFSCKGVSVTVLFSICELFFTIRTSKLKCKVICASCYARLSFFKLVANFCANTMLVLTTWYHIQIQVIYCMLGIYFI